MTVVFCGVYIEYFSTFIIYFSVYLRWREKRLPCIPHYSSGLTSLQGESSSSKGDWC